MLSLFLSIQGCMRVTPLGRCLRVIVNEKRLNLEKTTSSVLSVLLLIYGFIALPIAQTVAVFPITSFQSSRPIFSKFYVSENMK